MDLIEWEIKTTSDKCPYILEINRYDELLDIEYDIFECNHPCNISRFCNKENCTIKTK